MHCIWYKQLKHKVENADCLFKNKLVRKSLSVHRRHHFLKEKSKSDCYPINDRQKWGLCVWEVHLWSVCIRRGRLCTRGRLCCFLQVGHVCFLLWFCSPAGRKHKNVVVPPTASKSHVKIQWMPSVIKFVLTPCC